jgi:hypothetical protein
VLNFFLNATTAHLLCEIRASNDLISNDSRATPADSYRRVFPRDLTILERRSLARNQTRFGLSLQSERTRAWRKA